MYNNIIFLLLYKISNKINNRTIMEFITSIVDMDNIIFGTEIIPIIIRTIFFVIFFDIQFRLIHLLWPTMPKSEKHTPDKMRLWWSIKCSNVLHAVVIGPVATYAIFTDEKMVAIVTNLREWDFPAIYETILMTQESYFCPALVTFSVGFFVWDLIYSKHAESFEFLMVLHHVISILVWPIALNNGLANFFLLSFMASELSSPFIHVRWYIRSKYGQGMAWILMTLIFILAFIVVRIVVLPYILFGLYGAQTWRHPEIPLWLQILSTSTLYLPSLFNIWWMWFIIKMCMRFLCPSKKKKQ